MNRLMLLMLIAVLPCCIESIESYAPGFKFKEGERDVWIQYVTSRSALTDNDFLRNLKEADKLILDLRKRTPSK